MVAASTSLSRGGLGHGGLGGKLRPRGAHPRGNRSRPPTPETRNAGRPTQVVLAHAVIETCPEEAELAIQAGRALPAFLRQRAGRPVCECLQTAASAGLPAG